jgi:hypothetical protein
LLGLGLDKYKCDGVKQQQGYFMSLFTGEEDTVTTTMNRIIHPEAIHVLFELIKFADDESMILKCFWAQLLYFWNFRNNYPIAHLLTLFSNFCKTLNSSFS